jgi:hypothetical protein
MIRKVEGAGVNAESEDANPGFGAPMADDQNEKRRAN